MKQDWHKLSETDTHTWPFLIGCLIPATTDKTTKEGEEINKVLGANVCVCVSGSSSCTKCACRVQTAWDTHTHSWHLSFSKNGIRDSIYSCILVALWVRRNINKTNIKILLLLLLLLLLLTGCYVCFVGLCILHLISHL